MKVLVSWGSRMGGTEGIARMIGAALQEEGFDVDLRPASQAGDLGRYGAVVLGGALYANRWRGDVRRLAARNVAALRRVPVWLFSSGPLDDSADRSEIPPVREVAVLRDRIGALGHRTFGGRLTADAKGFPAAAMAKKLSGDWRNPERIRAWAADIARALPQARPGAAFDPPGRSLARLAAFGTVGAVLCAVLMGGLPRLMPAGWAAALNAVAAPLLIAAVAASYFRAYGARDPLPVAIAFTGMTAVLEVAVAGLVLRDFSMFASFAGTWLPFLLIFAATWATGSVVLMRPSRDAQG